MIILRQKVKIAELKTRRRKTGIWPQGRLWCWEIKSEAAAQVDNAKHARGDFWSISGVSRVVIQSVGLKERVLKKEPLQAAHFSFIARYKIPQWKQGEAGQRGNVTLFPLQRKGAQSLRKRTRALVSKLRLSEAPFSSEYHITNHQHGWIQR